MAAGSEGEAGFVADVLRRIRTAGKGGKAGEKEGGRPARREGAGATGKAVAHSAKSDEHPVMKAVRHFAGGTLGGMCGVAVSYPFDTVKVRMQTGGFNTMFGAFKHVATKEGMASFYKGVGAPLSAYGVIKAVTFGTYGNMLDVFAKQHGTSMVDGYKPSYTEVAAAGFAAGFTSTFVMAPSDAIKIAMQAGSTGGGPTFKNSWECAKYLVREKGFFTPDGLFKGTGATMARDAPSMALYYIVYDVAKKVMPPAKEDGTHAAWQMMLAGGLSGASSWLPVYPFDVLKSRLQQPGNNYKGMVDCAVRSVRAEGPFVLYQGLLPVLMGSMPLHGTVFMVYELFMQATGGH